MSILNTQDIERDVSIIEDGYGRAIMDFGESGGVLWIAVAEALRQHGLQYYAAAENVIGFNPAEPRRIHPHNNYDDYNLDEIARTANDYLLDNMYTEAVGFDWFEITDSWLKLTGKYAKMRSCSEKLNRITLYYNIENFTKQNIWR